MEILKEIVTGLVYGITEFMPVSSLGHIQLIDNLIGTQPSAFYMVLLNIGMLLAVVLVFYEDIWGIIRGFFEILLTLFANLLIFIKRRSGDTKYTYFKVIGTGYRKLAVMMIIAAIPTVLLMTAGKEMAQAACKNNLVIGVLWIIAGLVLFIANANLNGQQRIKEVNFSGAIFTGIAQGISILPGFSRTGAVITTGLVQGYNRKLAVKSAFLMAVPALICSLVMQTGTVDTVKIDAGMLAGAVLAVVAGYFSIKFMMNFIRKKKYTGFAIYNIAFGLILIIMYFI